MLFCGRGHSGVERRCSFGGFLDCGDVCTGLPMSLSSSIGVSGRPCSRFRCCGGIGISEGGAIGGSDTGVGAAATAVVCGALIGVTDAFFFPKLKKPRFVFALPPPSNEGRGACLLSRNEPVARVAPCPFALPLVSPLLVPVVVEPISLFAAEEGAGSSTSSSRSVESPSSSPAFLGMPRTGVRPGGSV